jgi:putative Holliday junction resolvase
VTVLGIDLGSKRIGLAISDEHERIALPAGVLESRGRAADLGALRRLAAERGVSRVVVGLPLHMSGRAGPEAEAARTFARELAETLALPVETLDERWSTVEAQRTLRETGQSRRKRGSGEADTLAATLLLSTYLERRARVGEGAT